MNIANSGSNFDQRLPLQHVLTRPFRHVRRQLQAQAAERRAYRAVDAPAVVPGDIGGEP